MRLVMEVLTIRVCVMETNDTTTFYQRFRHQEITLHARRAMASIDEHEVEELGAVLEEEFGTAQANGYGFGLLPWKFFRIPKAREIAAHRLRVDNVATV